MAPAPLLPPLLWQNLDIGAARPTLVDCDVTAAYVTIATPGSLSLCDIYPMTPDSAPIDSESVALRYRECGRRMGRVRGSSVQQVMGSTCCMRQPCRNHALVLAGELICSPCTRSCMADVVLPAPAPVLRAASSLVLPKKDGTSSRKLRSLVQ